MHLGLCNTWRLVTSRAGAHRRRSAHRPHRNRHDLLASGNPGQQKNPPNLHSSLARRGNRSNRNRPLRLQFVPSPGVLTRKPAFKRTMSVLKTQRQSATRPQALQTGKKHIPARQKTMFRMNIRRKSLCILVDDTADSAGTLCNAAEAVHQAGGKCVWAYATHGVLSPPALERIAAAPLIDLTVTDTICLPPEIQANKKIRQISIAPLLAEAIARIGTDRSVSSLFQAPVF